MFDIQKTLSDAATNTVDKAKSFVTGAVSSATNELDALNKKYNPFAGSGNVRPTRGNWKYPMTIQDTQHTSRLVFTATNAVGGDEPDSGRAKAFGNWKHMKFRDIGSVFMYMPKLQQTYTQNYSNDGRGLAWQVWQQIQSHGGLGNIMGDAGAAALQTIFTQTANGTAPGLVRDFSQVVKNQHMSSHFTGTELRQQKFDFELRPRNVDELIQIAGLLQFFKANSSTSLSAGDTMGTPSRWIIEELCTNTAGRIIPPFRFGPAYLTNITIDKTPDGAWKTFESGDPIAINLSLEFMEITIVTKEDIEKLYL